MGRKIRKDEPKKVRPSTNQNNHSIAKAIAALKNTVAYEANADRKEYYREDIGNKLIQIATLVFVMLTTAGIFYQAIIFSGQLSEMKSSGEQTAQLIENNAALAIAAGKQADAAEKQAVAMGEYAKVTRDSLIASQRAWVGPRNVKTDGPPVLDQPLEAILEYQNTGREPATETIRDIDVFTVTKEEDEAGVTSKRIDDFISKCKIIWRPQQASVVYPTTGFAAGYNFTNTIPGALIDEDVVAGTKSIVAAGCFVYKTFGQIHRSWFCYFFRNGKTKPSTWNICETGNNAD
jgi:carboxylesterase type B